MVSVFPHQFISQMKKAERSNGAYQDGPKNLENRYFIVVYSFCTLDFFLSATTSVSQGLRLIFFLIDYIFELFKNSIILKSCPKRSNQDLTCFWMRHVKICSPLYYMFIAKFLCKRSLCSIFYGRPNPRFISISMVFSTLWGQICTGDVILLPCFPLVGVSEFGAPFPPLVSFSPSHLLLTTPSMLFWGLGTFFLVTPPWVIHLFDLPLVFVDCRTQRIVYVDAVNKT